MTTLRFAEDAINTMFKDAARIKDLEEALQELICCPAFTGALFEKDKESHIAWTRARFTLENVQEK